MVGIAARDKVFLASRETTSEGGLCADLAGLAAVRTRLSVLGACKTDASKSHHSFAWRIFRHIFPANDDGNALDYSVLFGQRRFCHCAREKRRGCFRRNY